MRAMATLEKDARTRRSAGAAATPLALNFCGLEFASPIVLLSGCVGFGEEYTRIEGFSNRDAGAIVLKGTTGKARLGNPPHRVFETPAGMLNAIGLQNIGAAAFLEEKLPKLQQMKNIVVLANVFGYTREDYERTIEILNDGEGIAAYELNVSCPNTAHGGLQFGCDPRSLDEVVTTAKRAATRPLMVAEPMLRAGSPDTVAASNL